MCHVCIPALTHAGAPCRDGYLSTNKHKLVAHICKHTLCTGAMGQTQSTYISHAKPSPRCNTFAQTADIPLAMPSQSSQGLQEPPGTTARDRGNQC